MLDKLFSERLNKNQDLTQVDVKGRFIYEKQGLAKICSISIEKTLNKGDCFKSIVVIPARYQSSRLSGKTLLPIDGVPMVVKVMQQVQKSCRIHKVIVATDHPDILQAVESFGGVAQMTSSTCECGTDRVAEVAKMYPEYDLVIMFRKIRWSFLLQHWMT